MIIPEITAVYACDKGFNRWKSFFQRFGNGSVELVSMDDPTAQNATVAVAWLPPQGYLASLRRLQLMCSMGMGVDGLVDDSEISTDIPIVRLVDETIAAQMTEYVLSIITWDRRRMADYQESQRLRKWQQHPVGHAHDTVVTILGLGVIGSAIAQSLSRLGYQVRGWRNKAQAVDGVQVYAGLQEWDDALSGAHYIVNVLPKTAATIGILNKQRLHPVSRSAHLINIARGAHIVEEDLLALLASGKLAKATLDVTATEPLPESHPFWHHPNIFITPHISGVTYPESAAQQILQTINAFSKGEVLSNVVDRSVGY